MKHEVSTLTYQRTIGSLLKKYSYQSRFRKPSWPKDLWIEFDSMSEIKSGPKWPPGTLIGRIYNKGVLNRIIHTHKTSYGYRNYMDSNRGAELPDA